MTYFLLHHADSNLKAEARWLLLQWARRLGPEASFTGTLKALYERLGMTHSQGRRAWKSLMLAEVMVGKSVSASPRRGRSLKRYAIAPGFLEQWRAAERDGVGVNTVDPGEEGEQDVEEGEQDVEEAAKVHGPEIAALIENEEHSPVNQMSGEQRKQHLLLTSRWVLMVLLAHANVPGIVTGLSYAALQQLTGMSISRLSSQLQKLQYFGVIVYDQPGQKGLLLKERMRAIYQLNLAHPFLGKPECEAVALYFPLREGFQVHLINDFLDALVAYNVCLKQEETLWAKYNRLYSMSADTTLSQPVNAEPVASPHFLNMVEALEKEWSTLKEVRGCADELLRHLDLPAPMIKACANIRDASRLDWLRADVHAEAMCLLSTQWRHLGDTDPLPNAPDAVKNPKAALTHGLAHPLANALANQLKQLPRPENDIGLEALHYTLTKKQRTDGRSKQLVWVLQGYALRTNDVAHLTKGILNGMPISYDLRSYWQAHR